MVTKKDLKGCYTKDYGDYVKQITQITKSQENLIGKDKDCEDNYRQIMKITMRLE